MGGLAGIVHWDGSPIDPIDLGRMVRASAHRGEGPAPSERVRTSDADSSGVGPRAAFAHLRFNTSLPPDGDQPLFFPEHGLTFIFDGRLDNRGDLIATLGLDRALSNAHVAAAAFTKWDHESPRRLIGDFAFVAWDARRRRLVAARDHIGVRHLHYFASTSRLVCATDLAQVIAHREVPREPNREIAADYLAIDVRSGPGTLYRDVNRLPGGHVLVAEDGRVELRQDRTPEPGAPVRYARDEEYAEACREILVRSVEARMQSDRPVAAMLSGGVDSSTVVSIAHRAVRGAGPAPQPFSMIFPDHPESDERPFIEAVARHCGTRSIYVEPAPIDGDRLRRQASAWSDAPSMPADETARTLYESMRAHGYRVALTGAGGDFLFTGSVFQYADLLRRFRVVAAVRQFMDDWKADDTGVSPLGLLQAGVWPLLPLPVKNALRPLARRAVDITDQPEWLRIERPPVEPFPREPRGGSYATEDVTRLVGCGMLGFFMDAAERAAAQAGIELRHPLLDVRLIEFALAIPDDQRKRGSCIKYVLRGAVGDDLVPMVRERRTKGDFAHAIAEAAEALGGEAFFGRLQIAEAGWVHGDVVAARYRQMRDEYAAGPAVYGRHVPALWMIAAVELWFRGVHGGLAR